MKTEFAARLRETSDGQITYANYRTVLSAVTYPNKDRSP